MSAPLYFPSSGGGNVPTDTFVSTTNYTVPSGKWAEVELYVISGSIDFNAGPTTVEAPHYKLNSTSLAAPLRLSTQAVNSAAGTFTYNITDLVRFDTVELTVWASTFGPGFTATATLRVPVQVGVFVPTLDTAQIQAVTSATGTNITTTQTITHTNAEQVNGNAQLILSISPPGLSRASGLLRVGLKEPVKLKIKAGDTISINNGIGSFLVTEYDA
jgi:hypothetical protein